MLTQTVPGLVCCRHSTGCLEHSLVASTMAYHEDARPRASMIEEQPGSQDIL
jgi:hypothetical protein